MTGWKSIVLYAVIAYINHIKINLSLVIKSILISLFLLIVFSIINMSRQGVAFSEMTMLSTISFTDVLYYYLAYGFLNFAYNLQQLSEVSLFLPLNLGNEIINPTWNVQSGFHGLLNTLGILGGSAFLMGLRIVGSYGRKQGFFGNYFNYIMILTIVMFHNTMIALSPIVYIFPVFLYAFVFIWFYMGRIKLKR